MSHTGYTPLYHCLKCDHSPMKRAYIREGKRLNYRPYITIGFFCEKCKYFHVGDEYPIKKWNTRTERYEYPATVESLIQGQGSAPRERKELTNDEMIDIVKERPQDFTRKGRLYPPLLMGKLNIGRHKANSLLAMIDPEDTSEGKGGLL